MITDDSVMSITFFDSVPKLELIMLHNLCTLKLLPCFYHSSRHYRNNLWSIARLELLTHTLIPHLVYVWYPKTNPRSQKRNHFNLNCVFPIGTCPSSAWGGLVGDHREDALHFTLIPSKIVPMNRTSYITS